MTLTDATGLSRSDASKSETEQDICNVVSPSLIQPLFRLLLKGEVPLPLPPHLRHFTASLHPRW